ncbi:hypothetical protein [Agriterribacter sp.]|uniref:hypothetical protein n=1 Tax=Agriterribacter sp. TaxID=2821509 RepID=UPI002C6598C0|nr:hypothetical protein [Agriterribacter sp.]HRO46975.1 hypothetical protein [Agriterribacter sp.]HRQ18449.1 hypothetical protein [Agriterribacter sp.]
MINNKFAFILVLLIGFALPSFSQVIDSLKTDTAKSDTIFRTIPQEDSVLRIRNLNPYITLHVDSTLQYKLDINKDQSQYYWFLKNSPVGLKIERNSGLLTFKAEKAFFLSGRLKYDLDYKVDLGVQNLDDPKDKIDTSFTLLFFNTEIIPSKIKPSVNNILYVDEGDSVSFKVQCEDGNFPIENITMTSNYPIKTIGTVTKCGDDFKWSPPFGFVKPSDKDKQKEVIVNFVGANKFNVRDTATIRIVVKENINYPQKVLEYNEIVRSIQAYSNRLKATFMELDKKIKSTRGARTTFDLTSAASSLGGTVFSSLPTDGQKTAGKILPSVGVAMVPVKESVSPVKKEEQNSATLVRNSIKRLDYLLQNNVLVGEKDPELINKSQKLREELKQIQLQLIEVPVVEFGDSPEELDKYFNNPKVAKKYRMRKS